VNETARPRVTFLGHSTVLLAMDGTRILTDPILRLRVGPLRRIEAVAAERWSGLDAVLISHSHWDHLDWGSLRLLDPGTTMVVPRGLAGQFRQRRFSHVEELRPGDRAEVGGLTVEATHAEHHGFGPPVGGTSLSVGYVVAGSQQVYFAGDTAFFEGMSALDRGLDLALVPVWGWGPTARASEHLDPMGAARAVSVIRPRYAVPIHWGTLHPLGLRWLRPSTRIDPPHQFAQMVRRLAPGTEVRVLPVGSSLDLEPPSRTA
jgi:L-ascorbate metabolism protein UlaG (beta-lactamase superfamily)